MASCQRVTLLLCLELPREVLASKRVLIKCHLKDCWESFWCLWKLAASIGWTERVENWWLAVHIIAGLVNSDGIEPWQDSLLRHELDEQGFSSEAIHQALEWVDQASLSGRLFEALSMLQKEPAGARIAHPLEKISIPELLWQTLQNLRQRGFIAAETTERLVEGLRFLDPRDWDEDDIKSFLEELLSISVPCLNGLSLSDIISMRVRECYH